MWKQGEFNWEAIGMQGATIEIQVEFDLKEMEAIGNQLECFWKAVESYAKGIVNLCK